MGKGAERGAEIAAGAERIRRVGGSVVPSADAALAAKTLRIWYGFYPNGRETLLALEAAKGDNLVAIYAVGPSIDDKFPATWGRRVGREIGGDYVFAEPGKNTLRFHPRPDGRARRDLAIRRRESSVTAQMRRIDPRSLVHRTSEGGAQPQ